MTRQRLVEKLSILYGLPCVYEDSQFVIKGPTGCSLISIGELGNKNKSVLFGIGIARDIPSYELAEAGD